MRLKPLLALIVGLALHASAETGVTLLTSSNIQSANHQPMKAGDVTITPEDANRSGANYRLGIALGGVGSRLPVKAVVIDGVLKSRGGGVLQTGVYLIDACLTTPNIRYHIEIRDTTQLASAASAVDVHGVPVCGTTYDFNQFNFPETPGPGAAPTFTGGHIDGDLTVSGTITAANVTGGSGLVPFTESFTSSANGTNTTFVLAGTPTLVVVSRNGLAQTPGTTYTIAGNTITFAAPPLSGDVLDAQGFYPATSGSVGLAPFGQVLTGLVDGSNRSFNIAHAPVFLVLARNGIVQASSNFTIVGTTITFTTAPLIGDSLYAQGLY